MRLLTILFILFAFTHLHAQNTGIGIGIISPHESAILQVVSPDNDKGVLFPSFTSGTVGGIQNPADGLLIYRTDENTHYQYSAANGWQPLTHWLKNGDDIYNTNSGNVGIGTISPASKFNVEGNGAATELFRVSNDRNATKDSTLVLTSAGRLGVGTTAPAYKLTVQTATNTYGLMHTDGAIKIGTYVGGSIGGGQFGTVSNHPLGFYTNDAAPSLNITTSGRVGIGTANPSYKLQVNSGSVNGLRIESLSGTTALSVGGTGVVDVDAPNVAGGRLRIREDGYSEFGKGILVTGYGPSGISGSASIGSYIIFDNTTGLIANGSGLSRAAYFLGNVEISGSISKSSGSFKIDHPLDPANKFLYHSFVESPDMMNVYNGNVITDGSGVATVELPDYFEALNKDFRYQLTVIGTFARAIVEKEISDNAFVIKTDLSNVKVSWQVTGIRKDAYAEMYRIPNTVEKTGKERGKYLHPEIFGASEDLRIIPGTRMPETESEKKK